MTAQQQRIAIAEFCGLTWQEGETPIYGGKYLASGYWKSGKFIREELPDYLNDLNAIAQAEAKLTDIQMMLMRTWLDEICERAGRDESTVDSRLCTRVWRATAAQRAEALLRTIGRWSDTDPEISAVMRLGNVANDALCQHCRQPGSDHRVGDAHCPSPEVGWSRKDVYQP